MARAIEMNGIYESMHGSPGERGCVRFGGDKMALCVGHSLDAMAFARLSQADNIVSLSRPFKVWFWRVTPQPCEACALEDAAQCAALILRSLSGDGGAGLGARVSEEGTL